MVVEQFFFFFQGLVDLPDGQEDWQNMLVIGDVRSAATAALH